MHRYYLPVSVRKVLLMVGRCFVGTYQEREKHGIQWSKASRSGVVNHVRMWRGFFRQLVVSCTGKEVKDILKEGILVP